MPVLGRTDLAQGRGLAARPAPQGMGLSGVTDDQAAYAATMALRVAGLDTTSGSFTANSGVGPPRAAYRLGPWVPRFYPNGYSMSYSFFNQSQSNRGGVAYAPPAMYARMPKGRGAVPAVPTRRGYFGTRGIVEKSHVTNADVRAIIDEFKRDVAQEAKRFEDRRGGVVNVDYNKMNKEFAAARKAERDKNQSFAVAMDKITAGMAGLGLDREAMEGVERLGKAKVTSQFEQFGEEGAKKRVAEEKTRIEREMKEQLAEARRLAEPTGMETEPARITQQLAQEYFANEYARYYWAHREDMVARGEAAYEDLVQERANRDAWAGLASWVAQQNLIPVLDGPNIVLNRRDQQSRALGKVPVAPNAAPWLAAAVPAPMDADGAGPSSANAPLADMPADGTGGETIAPMETDGTAAAGAAAGPPAQPPAAEPPQVPPPGLAAGQPQSNLAARVRENEARIIYNIRGPVNFNQGNNNTQTISGAAPTLGAGQGPGGYLGPGSGSGWPESAASGIGPDDDDSNPGDRPYPVGPGSDESGRTYGPEQELSDASMVPELPELMPPALPSGTPDTEEARRRALGRIRAPGVPGEVGTEPETPPEPQTPEPERRELGPGGDGAAPAARPRRPRRNTEEPRPAIRDTVIRETAAERMRRAAQEARQRALAERRNLALQPVQGPRQPGPEATETPTEAAEAAAAAAAAARQQEAALSRVRMGPIGTSTPYVEDRDLPTRADKPATKFRTGNRGEALPAGELGTPANQEAADA